MILAALSFYIGEVLNQTVAVCVTKESVVAIIEADRKDGPEAAQKVWEAKEDCGAFSISGPEVGRVVYSAPVTREGKTQTLRAVEIVSNGKVLGYFLTVLPVTAKLERIA